MKALLLLSLFSFSTMAFSATQAETVEAISSTLSMQILSCTRANGEVFLASDLNLSSLNTDYRIVVSRDSQPVFTFENRKESTLSIATFSTDSTFTFITLIDIKNYELKKVRRNMGTLLDPVFQVVEIKNLVDSVSCK